MACFTNTSPGQIEAYGLIGCTTRDTHDIGQDVVFNMSTGTSDRFDWDLYIEVWYIDRWMSQQHWTGYTTNTSKSTRVYKVNIFTGAGTYRFRCRTKINGSGTYTNITRSFKIRS